MASPELLNSFQERFRGVEKFSRTKMGYVLLAGLMVLAPTAVITAIESIANGEAGKATLFVAEGTVEAAGALTLAAANLLSRRGS